MSLEFRDAEVVEQEKKEIEVSRHTQGEERSRRVLQFCC